MQHQKGSITIFALLAMLLVMTTLFSFLECSRYHDLKRLAVLQTESAIESAFANYSSYLWDYYHLLGCNLSQMEPVITEIGNSRYDETTGRSNLLLFTINNINIQAHTRLTDGEGTAYIHAISKYMKTHILYDAAKEIFNRYEAVKNIKENSMWDILNMDVALEQLNTAKEQIQKQDTTIENADVQNSEDIEDSKEMSDAVAVGSSKESDGQIINPLEVMKQLQKNGILELVLEDTANLSEKQILLENAVSNRKLIAGNQEIEETEWIDTIFLQQYLLDVMSNFCEKKDGHSLFYEAEYLIGGMEYDYENLKVVAAELMLIREAANFLYLMSDTEKVEEAGALAATLVGISGNTILIEAVKVGILTAWAFGESILDVRALLQNKRIPLLKNKNIWTLELDNIEELSKGYMTAKEGEQGLCYEEYLGILLLFQSEKKLAMRGMDMQEITLQELYQNPNLYLDEFITNVEIKAVYEYRPIFYSFYDIFQRWDYAITVVQNYGY